MLTLEGLVQDIIQRRGKLGSKEGADSAQDYQEVWSAFANYVRSCLEQRRGLQLNSFCKIGYTIQKKLGKNSYRPYFHFSDSFVRSYLNPEAARKHAAGQLAGDLCAFEDFNFSKAALKFSKQLTKDQVFTMLRALVQRMGDSISEGREMDVVLGDVGKFVCRADGPRFQFAQEFYRQDLPESDSRATPAPRREGAAAVASAPAAPRVAAQPAATGNSATQDATVATLVPENTQPEDVKGFDSGVQRAMGETDLQKSASAPGLSALQFKRELAFKEAMDRHIAAMEHHAAEAVAEKDAWESHVSECLLQEREEIQARKERNHLNLHFLKHQMALGEQKRKEQRKEDIEAASAHDFPAFSEVHPNEMKGFVKVQQEKVRQALDDQVRTNNTLRNLAKQKDLAMELCQLQANREELAMLRSADRAKKAFDRESLATAWNADIRMKNIWKAIDNHGKVSKKEPSKVAVGEALPPPSRAGSTISAGRIMTGSARRTPLSCSTSLSQLEARAGNGKGLF